MRQTIAALPINLFINFYGYWQSYNALRVLRYASQFVTLLAFPPHSSRQLLCPSCHFVHFVLRSATLHHVRSLTICCKAWHTFQHTKQSTSDAHSFSQNNATILTGFHSATLRPTFTSVAFSPPAANNFACLACLPQLRVCHGFCPAAQSLDENKNTRQTLAFLVAVYRRFTAL